MATTASHQDTTLCITRTFAAPQEKVFQAWTDPEKLTRWFKPSDDFSTFPAEVDLRVGGQYRIRMNAPDGSPHTVVGTYREVIPPHKLVLTWAWADGEGCSGPEAGGAETLVTVEFQARGNSTEVILTHELFPNSDVRNKHHQGWSDCLNSLAKNL